MRHSKSALPKRLAWILLVVVSATIWFVSTRPDVPETGSGVLDYVAGQSWHIIAHVALGGAAGLAAFTTWRRRTALWAAIGIAIPHALLDEWVQQLLPYRNANIEDVTCNTLGAIAGILIYDRWLNARVQRLFDIGKKKPHCAHKL